VGEYAESLHHEVEVIAKKHHKTLSTQLNDSKHQLQAMLVADRITRALLDFGRSEEMVAMAHDVRERLHAFQSVPDTQVRPRGGGQSQRSLRRSMRMYTNIHYNRAA